MVNFGGQHDASVLKKLNAHVMVPDQLVGPYGEIIALRTLYEHCYLQYIIIYFKHARKETVSTLSLTTDIK